MEGITHRLPWLFLTDLLHQVLFYFGGVVATGIFLWERKRKVPIQGRWVFYFLLFCLFLSCFQTWVDEHHNSERLIRQKSDLVGQVAYWKDQTFAKDGAITSRDQLILQGFQTLSATQQTENKTQQSLTALSSKIFDLTKPQPVRVISRATPVNMPNRQPNTPNVAILIAETDGHIGSFSGKIVCESSFQVLQASMLEGWMSRKASYSQQLGQKEVKLGFNESAWDVQQPIVAIVEGNGLDADKCSIMQQ